MRTVTSRSVPVTRSVLPVTSINTPCRIGSAARAPTARPAAEHVDEIVSFGSDTHRDPFLFYFSLNTSRNR